MKSFMLRTVSLLVMATATAAPLPPYSKEVFKKVYACTSTARPTGLVWNSNQWEPATFKERGAFMMTLRITDDGAPAPVERTVHFSLEGASTQFFCSTPSTGQLGTAGAQVGFDFDGTRSCVNARVSIVFKVKDERGVISYVEGGVGLPDGVHYEDSNTRDKLWVMPFKCNAM